MTNEQAYTVLENCASLLDSGTRFFTEDHTKQFREAYELAMKALRKTERKTGKWRYSRNISSISYSDMMITCDQCGYTKERSHGDVFNFCPSCGAKMEGNT